MKLFIILFTLTATIILTENTSISTPGSFILLRKGLSFSSQNSKVFGTFPFFIENGILMPELLLARTLSIFTSQLLHEKKESKEEIDQAQKSWMTTKKTPDSPAANKWEFEQENFRKNVSWKLAKLVQFGETSLRTVEEIGYTSIGEIEGDSEPNDNEIHETEGSSETNLLESNYNKDYINSLSNSAITENEDEYDILNKKIQILIIQAQKALQRPCTEFDQFDIAIDDIGTDLEFFAFMNHIDEILQQAKTKSYLKLDGTFIITCLFYIFRIIFVFFILFGLIPYTNIFVGFCLMYISHFGALWIMNFLKYVRFGSK